MRRTGRTRGTTRGIPAASRSSEPGRPDVPPVLRREHAAR
jgi:hypothetical protein